MHNPIPTAKLARVTFQLKTHLLQVPTHPRVLPTSMQQIPLLMATRLPLLPFHSTTPHFYSYTSLLQQITRRCFQSRNIDLFWDLLNYMARRRFANDKTFLIELKTLGGARELKKCVEFFHLMNSNAHGYKIETLNKVIEAMCGGKLVEEAKFVAFKLKERIKLDGVTYKHLIGGFCDKGDLIEASKIWNLMVDEGFDPDVDAVEKMMERLFKVSQFSEALKLFQTMRLKRMTELDLSTYRLVIKRMSKKGLISQAQEVFDDMRERGIRIDNLILGYVVYRGVHNYWVTCYHT